MATPNFPEFFAKIVDAKDLFHSSKFSCSAITKSLGQFEKSALGGKIRKTAVKRLILSLRKCNISQKKSRT
jgi:hypothetical protein